MNIKNIIFDMGQVLIRFEPKEIVSRYVKDEKDIHLLCEAIFNCAEWHLLDWGKITEEDLINIAKDRLPDYLKKYVEPIIKKWDLPMNNMPGMKEIVKELKNKGYKLYLLSNAGPRHNEYWKRVAGSEYFDGKITSANEKDCKPNLSFFKTLLDRYCLKAEECLFIDDNIVNLAAAKTLGFNCYHFCGFEYIREYIKIL